MPEIDDDALRAEALAWLKRLKASGNEQYHAEFETWYSADPRHARVYEAVLDRWEQSSRAGDTPAGKNRPTLQDQWRGTTVTRLVVGIAASLIIAVLVGFGLVRSGVLDQKDGPVVIASHIGDIKTIALPDGSRITLDTDSMVRTDFRQSIRRLLLRRGRARFDVAHDADRPFIVEARGFEVVAHGTVFDVDVRGDHAKVSLLRGSVEVRKISSADDNTVSKNVSLKPGQRIVMAGSGVSSAPRNFRIAQTRWVAGMLSFENAPLREVVATANRYGKKHIILRTRRTGDRRFTGTFKANDSESLAPMLAKMFGLALTRDEQGNYLLAEQPE